MEFKVFLLCFAFLAVTTSAASVCECGSNKKDSASDSVKKYRVKMNKDGKNYEEKIDIDTQNETETFHVPKTSSDNEEGDIVYDFKKNLTMVRLPVDKSCFLSEGTDDVPKPADLEKLLESKDGVAISKSQTEVKLKVTGTLEDRSQLSDEMAELCAKMPIYLVVEGEPDSTEMVKPTSRAIVKRGLWRWICKVVCNWICRKICSGWVCRTVCNWICNRVCNWVWVVG